MKSIFIPILILSIALFGACKKASDDITSPIVTILSPVEDARQASSDSMLVHVLVEDEDLHDYRVTIKYYEGAALCCTVLDFKRHSHDKLVEYRRMMAPQMAGRYNIAVYAIDHNGNDTAIDHDFEVE